MEPEQIARLLTRAAERLTVEMRKAERASQTQAIELARQYSQGPYSTAELRRLGHPYARRHGAPGLDPSLINRQSGLLARSWRREGPLEKDGGLHTSVFNDAPEAFFMGGTEKMFERPLPERVLAEIERD